MHSDKLGNTVDTPVPAWILAPYEEKKIRADLQERTNQICARQFIEMGKCTADHQLLFSWYCSEQKAKLLECVAYWGSHDQFDKMREEYIENKKVELIKEGKL